MGGHHSREGAAGPGVQKVRETHLQTQGGKQGSGGEPFTLGCSFLRPGAEGLLCPAADEQIRCRETAR